MVHACVWRLHILGSGSSGCGGGGGGGGGSGTGSGDGNSRGTANCNKINKNSNSHLSTKDLTRVASWAQIKRIQNKIHCKDRV